MSIWYGIWSSEKGAWAATQDGRILWGPEPVIQAQWRAIPDEAKTGLSIEAFNVFGQPSIGFEPTVLMDRIEACDPD